MSALERSHYRERVRQARNELPELSTGSNHRPSAYGCRLWTGDRAPLDLGHCPTCEPPLTEQDQAWLDRMLIRTTNRGGGE